MTERVRLSEYSRNILIIIGVFLFFACQSEAGFKADRGKLELLEQARTPEQRAGIHHNRFGSRLSPLDWYYNLVDAAGNELATESNLVRWGEVPSNISQTNPQRLPVGFTIDKDENGTHWTGQGCAVCRTGTVEYQGKQILPEGGQGLVGFILFAQF